MRSLILAKKGARPLSSGVAESLLNWSAASFLLSSMMLHKAALKCAQLAVGWSRSLDSTSSANLDPASANLNSSSINCRASVKRVETVFLPFFSAVTVTPEPSRSF